MKRPLLFVTIGYILGILIELYGKNRHIALFYILFLSLFIITKINIIYKICKNLKRYIKLYIKFTSIVIIVVSMLFGYTYTHFLNQKYNNLYKSIEPQSYFVAKIISKMEEKKYTDCYTIKVISIEGKKEYNGTKLLLYVAKLESNFKYQYGDYIYLKGDYVTADTARNYGGFNYREYLKKDGIYGIVKASYDNIKLLKNENSIIFAIKESIIAQIRKILPQDSANLLLGILIGDKDSLQEEYIEYFRKSSLTHILCVSGGNINYIIMGATYILNKINLRKKYKEIITIIILIFFLFLVGLSPSVIRAVFMASLLLISKIFYRKIDSINSICISILFLLLINPYYLQDIGMALSYGGTIGIIVFSKNIRYLLDKWIPDKKFLKIIKDALSVCIAAQILILPITVFYFNQINILFFVANVLVVPILGLITILGFFTLILSYICFSLSKIIAYILHFLLQLLIFISKLSSRNSIFQYNSSNS